MPHLDLHRSIVTLFNIPIPLSTRRIIMASNMCYPSSIDSIQPIENEIFITLLNFLVWFYFLRTKIGNIGVNYLEICKLSRYLQTQRIAPNKWILMHVPIRVDTSNQPYGITLHISPG